MFTIKYSRSGHDIATYTPYIDWVGGPSSSLRRYIVTAVHSRRGEELYALAWTRKGAERKMARLSQKRFTRPLFIS